MKKKLLLITLALSFTISNAQVIIDDNYNSLTVGDVGTSFDGSTAGQDNYFTQGLANSEFQIASDGATGGNEVNIIGSAAATGTKYMWKDISASWAGRTSGNNILNVEFDVYTGAATTSKNSARLFIYSDSVLLAGLLFNFETKAISGIAYYNNAGTLNSYSFALGDAGASLILDASSWVRLGVSYNTDTNEVIWKGPGFYGGVPGAIPATGTNQPIEIDYVHGAGTGNTVSVTSRFDNLLANASATEDLLGSTDYNLVENKFSVSPNPANDFITVSNTANFLLSEISITDLNGRVVKHNSYSNVSNVQVNISDLSSGVYMIKITSDQGTATKKIVKN